MVVVPVPLIALKASILALSRFIVPLLVVAPPIIKLAEALTFRVATLVARPVGFISKLPVVTVLELSLSVMVSVWAPVDNQSAAIAIDPALNVAFCDIVKELVVAPPSPTRT